MAQKLYTVLFINPVFHFFHCNSVLNLSDKFCNERGNLQFIVLYRNVAHTAEKSFLLQQYAVCSVCITSVV